MTERIIWNLIFLIYKGFLEYFEISSLYKTNLYSKTKINKANIIYLSGFINIK